MTRGSSHRPERLAALLHETLADALATEVKDPRIGFVTVTAVSVTPDGGQATIRVSVLGSEEEKSQALEGLSSARGFLRTHLARSLPLRVAPELVFELDRGLEHQQRIDQILHDLKESGQDS